MFKKKITFTVTRIHGIHTIAKIQTMTEPLSTEWFSKQKISLGELELERMSSEKKTNKRLLFYLSGINKKLTKGSGTERYPSLLGGLTTFTPILKSLGIDDKSVIFLWSNNPEAGLLGLEISDGGFMINVYTSAYIEGIKYTNDLAKLDKMYILHT